MLKLNNSQFNELKRLVYHASGINLEGKPQLVETRLAKRFRVIGKIPVDDYIRMLKSDPLELSAFIDTIATTHTFFFRESRPFSYLDKKSCRAIWCAACATGEEPFSVMIHCLEKGFTPYVLGTDISSEALRRAQAGVYGEDRLRHTPRPLTQKYFIPEQGAGETCFRIKPQVKERVVFDQSNLITDDIPERLFDVIFCRNVMIYFDLSTKSRVVEKMYYALRPGGYFIVGGAESLSVIKHRFTFVSPSVYQKP